MPHRPYRRDSARQQGPRPRCARLNRGSTGRRGIRLPAQTHSVSGVEEVVARGGYAIRGNLRRALELRVCNCARTLAWQRWCVLSVGLMQIVKFAYVLHDFLWVVFDDE